MRAAIFIDGGYLIKQMHEARVAADYRRLSDYLLEPVRKSGAPVDLLRCYFYYCAPWMSEKPTEDEKRRMAAHDRFAEEIESIERWEFRLGKLERRREGGQEFFEQKRVDVMLSVDLVRHAAAGHIQHAILVAGDSDFIPAVIAAKQSGVTITLTCHQDKSVHKDLLRTVDAVRWIDWSKFPKRQQPKTAAVAPALPGETSAPESKAKDEPKTAPAKPAAQKPQAAKGETSEEPRKTKARRGRRSAPKEQATEETALKAHAETETAAAGEESVTKKKSRRRRRSKKKATTSGESAKQDS